jgi:hypothetical protein
VWGIGAAAAYAWAGSDYLSNVVLNQVGSFPRADVLGYSPLIYFKNKVVGEGAKVLALEGPLIFAALAAIALGWHERAARFGRDSDEYRQWEYAAWYALGMLLSIGFVMKGGTVNYIFVLGEPAVAIFGADAIVRMRRWIAGGGEGPDAELLRARAPLVARVVAACTGVVLGIGAGFHTRSWLVGVLAAGILGAGFERFAAGAPWLQEKARTRTGRVLAGAALAVALLWPDAWHNVRLTMTEVQCELPAERVRELMDIIEAHSEPGDPILAPPFYAYMTHRTVAAELAENYLWQIKFINDMADGVEGEGVLKMQELGRLLREQRVPLVLLDVNQTGRIPVVRDAIEQAYRPLSDAPYPSRNTQLGLYVPERPR